MTIEASSGAMKIAPDTYFYLWLACRHFRSEFVGFALVAHHLESAFSLFVRGRNFSLYLGGSLFHFWREADVAVVLHAGSGRDKASDNDVLFQAAQVIDLAVDAGFGEHARGLLERRGGDERVG